MARLLLSYFYVVDRGACMKQGAHIGVALFLACSFWAARTHSDHQIIREPVPNSTPMERFTVLTYNILHGLEVRGWSVGPGESKEEQATRFNLQARQLSLAQADVMLLQEVNPLPDKAKAFVTALKTLGPQYTEAIRTEDRPRVE